MTNDKVRTNYIQYTGENATDVLKFMFFDIESEAVANQLTEDVLKKEMRVSINDYILQTVNGGFLAVTPKDFEYIKNK